MKKLILHFKIAWYGLLMLCVCLFLVLSAINGSALSEVRVKLNDGQKDYMDKNTINYEGW